VNGTQRQEQGLARQGGDLTACSNEEISDELRFAAFWCGDADTTDPTSSSIDVRALLEAAALRLDGPRADPGEDLLPSVVRGREGADAAAIVARAHAEADAIVRRACVEHQRLHADGEVAVRMLLTALDRLGTSHRTLADAITHLGAS
jgi:hypothetical protein